VMGCYGIGPARIVAAAIEQSYDDKGCIWPAPLAPFDAWLVPIGDEAIVARAAPRGRARRARAHRHDRRPRGQPGARFADADLIGVPLRVTLGKRTITTAPSTSACGATAARRRLPVDQAAARIADLSKGLRPR
jgi:prolyl-tRNA synthetase